MSKTAKRAARKILNVKNEENVEHQEAPLTNRNPQDVDVNIEQEEAPLTGGELQEVPRIRGSTEPLIPIHGEPQEVKVYGISGTFAWMLIENLLLMMGHTLSTTGVHLLIRGINSSIIWPFAFVLTSLLACWFGFNFKTNANEVRKEIYKYFPSLITYIFVIVSVCYLYSVLCWVSVFYFSEFCVSLMDKTPNKA